MGGRLSAVDLASQFRTVRVAIEDAVSLARIVMDEAYELVQEATAHGWEGLANVAQTAHDALEDGVSNLDSAQDAADQALAVAAEIHSVVNAGEIAHRLVGVIGQADEIRGALDIAITSVREACTWAQQAGASKFTSQISGLVESLDAVRRLALDARDAVEKEHQEAVAWGTRGGRGSFGVVPPEPVARWPGSAVKKGVAKVPVGWGAGIATKKGVGVRWADPSNRGNGVRVDRGNPNSPFLSQRVDHVIVRKDGTVIGRDGKPINGSIKENAEMAHIPLNEWLTWKSWYTP